MNRHQYSALRHVEAGELLSHRGTWGGPPGYRWQGHDGEEAGVVPPWETEALDALARQGLIATERRRGPLHARVTITPAGRAALAEPAYAA
ncbi:MAG TPA: hypothetical protein VJ870_15115 [Amycolatopsis sp.]|nr:hypothetical protein [Amycolatopsis sp.]